MNEQEERESEDIQKKMQETIGQVQDYYNTGKVEEIKNMTTEDMYRLLTELEQSVFWPAILKYTQMRNQIAQNAIVTIDPHVSPGNISKYQGAMIGLADLPTMVIQLVEKRKREVRESATQG